MNLAMKRKIATRDAIDVSGFPREGEFYIIQNFQDGVDYCDLKRAEWIWSIGRRKSDGVVLASTNSRFYQNPLFECLWLR